MKAGAAIESAGIDVRDAFFEGLCRIAAEDRDVIVLTDDQGAFGLEKLKKEFPDQYYNVGIAEQNLVAVAAGLALGGKIPFLYGIATFITMRCFEQIRVNLSCMRLHVTIIGSGPGYTYGSDGPTHHATQDVAIMRAVPDMAIFNPSDPIMTAALARLAHREQGPKYIRLEKGVLPCLYRPGQDFSTGFCTLRAGRDVMIVSTGVMVHRALEVAEELSRRSIDAGVVDLYRIKPVDTDALCSALERAGRVVAVEENSTIGGIGDLIAGAFADQGRMRPIQRIALADEHCYEYGNRDWLHRRKAFDVGSLTERIARWPLAR